MLRFYVNNYAILHEEPGHLQSLASARVLESIPYGYQGTTVQTTSQKKMQRLPAYFISLYYRF